MGGGVSNHDALIKFFSRGEWEQNHKSTYTSGKSKKVYLDGSSKYIVPDLMGQDEIIEIEATTEKGRIYKVEGVRKILIIGVDSFHAFDEVYLFSIEREGVSEREEDALKFYKKYGFDHHLEGEERVIKFIEQVRGGRTSPEGE